MAKKPSPQMTYLYELGNQVQSVINQIPEDEEPEMREIIKNLLNRWEIYPEPDQEKVSLGDWIVDMMNETGVLSIPSNPIKAMPQPIKLEDDQSPLMWLEEWLQANLP